VLGRFGGQVFAGDLREFFVGHRVAAVAPGGQAALERADAPDAFMPEQERHTGARGFVWSSTVKNDFAVTGKNAVFVFEVRGIHM